MFGTDGVRGVANKELTVEMAMQLGQAGAHVLSKDNGGKRPLIMVGCDTRLSGDMLANALMAGACSVGANVIYLGVLPTPAVAYLAKTHRADAGVVISASHNPMEFNGIKFFDGEGFKLPDATEDEIENEIRSGMADIEFPTGEGVGHIEYRMDAWHEYVDHSVETVPIDLTGMKVVVDTAEGASYRSNVEALRRLGASVIPIHNDPDGVNINRKCGSTHMGELQQKVLEEGASVGLAFDGDADRFLAVDEHGEIVDGDKIMAIIGNAMKKKGTLKGNTIGENTTGDGLLSCLHLLQVMKETGKPLSELAKIMKKYPQALINAHVDNAKKEHYRDYPEIVERIDALEKEFDGKGRVLIRPSGTEPLVRVMIEGENQEILQKKAEELAEFIEKTMA